MTAEVPGLISLELAIEERSGAKATKHIRRFMIDRAPALFLVPCGDPRCVDGEHDLTTDVMRALRPQVEAHARVDHAPRDPIAERRRVLARPRIHLM